MVTTRGQKSANTKDGQSGQKSSDSTDEQPSKLLTELKRKTLPTTEIQLWKDIYRISAGNEPSFWINVGLYTDVSYVQKLFAGSVVADYLYRNIKLESGTRDDNIRTAQMTLKHPYSTLLNANDLSSFQPSKNVLLLVKNDYITFTKNIGIKLDNWTLFARKIRLMRNIFGLSIHGKHTRCNKKYVFSSGHLDKLMNNVTRKLADCNATDLRDNWRSLSKYTSC